ncbi:unnamed protein product, partial [Amoebophrya sp. A25]|eukprot:GSA25T00019810001.1
MPPAASCVGATDEAETTSVKRRACTSSTAPPAAIEQEDLLDLSKSSDRDSTSSTLTRPAPRAAVSSYLDDKKTDTK